MKTSVVRVELMKEKIPGAKVREIIGSCLQKPPWPFEGP
jgi:hypothetical protein